jgi:hypothetical protein
MTSRLTMKRFSSPGDQRFLQAGGKPKYVEAVLRGLTETERIALARRCLTTFPERCAISVQDALWWNEAGGIAAISEVTRLAIADGLDGRRMHPKLDPGSFLGTFAHYKGDGFGPPIVGLHRVAACSLKGMRAMP